MSKGLLQLTSEWGQAGEPLSQGERRMTSEANRSKESKLGDMDGGGDGPTDKGTILKKKRTPKFLVKQFGMITKGSSGASPRRNLKLLGKDYVVAIPGSALANSRALASTSETTAVDPVPNLDNAVSEPVNQHRSNNVAKPPIEFVTAPIDYETEDAREEPPFDFVTEHITARVTARGSLSRSHSSVARSPSGSERLSYTPRGSERSVISVPETVISSAEQGYSVKSASRTTSPSSLAEWSGGSLDRHGELSIAGLSLGEGRNISGLSRRTDVTSAQSPARSETQALDYSPDDTDSGVEMYHETTSASPGSYSRRSSCSLSEEWISEFEDSDGVSHHYRRSKHRNNNNNNNNSDQHHSRYSSRSQSGSARYSPSNIGQYSPSANLRKFVSKQFLDSPTSGKIRHGHGDHYYDHRRHHVDLPNSRHFSSRTHKRRDDEAAKSKVAVLLGKYGRKKGHQYDDMVALDSMSPQEAIAVFHDEVARMMLEEGEECVEANDVEEFLEGYMRLRSPFYSAMVDEFFRAVCVDCYKRPVEIVPVNGRLTSSKSLRSTMMQEQGL